MIKRTAEISGENVRLSISQGWLEVRKADELAGRVPLEDLGVLILDATTATYTHAVLTEVLAAGAVIVPCGKNHHPAGLFLPQNNTLQTRRIRAQADASRPLRKTLWKQIVQGKIASQLAALETRDGASPDPAGAQKALRILATQVRSGDPANVEAQAAKIYWHAFMGDSFRRDADGQPPNNFLNYGYMVLRAAVARAVCGAGLHPSLGLHHSNQYNDFCLADDLLEPLRPLVDLKARALWKGGASEIDRPAKTELLALLTAQIEVAGEKGPLLVGLTRYLASLVRCYQGEQKKLDLPKLCN